MGKRNYSGLGLRPINAGDTLPLKLELSASRKTTVIYLILVLLLIGAGLGINEVLPSYLVEASVAEGVPVGTALRTLTIMRHAKSSWRDLALDDFERPLNKRGRRDAPIMGQRLRAAGMQPSLMVASPAVRALMTAEVVAAELGYPRERLQEEPALYHASLRTLLGVVEQQAAHHTHLMLFGHNPGLNELIDYLVPGLTGNLPTAGVVSVGLEAPDWRVEASPPVELLLHDWPKQSPQA